MVMSDGVVWDLWELPGAPHPDAMIRGSVVLPPCPIPLR